MNKCISPGVNVILVKGDELSNLCCEAHASLRTNEHVLSTGLKGAETCPTNESNYGLPLVLFEL
jgi:hypothetical protein